MKTWFLFLTLVTFLFLWQCQQANQEGGSNDEKQQSEETDQIEAGNKKRSTESIKKAGKKIVKASGKALIGQLSNAISKGGIDHAIKFCSHKATALTDSLSKAHGAQVARVSHKNRNPNNAADSLEMALINEYQARNKADQTLKPQLKEQGGKKVYYHPITIKSGLCLNCHGEKGQDINVEDYIVIQNQYPNDKAIGFEMGDLRGLWKVQFKQKAL